ncbi:hypothetical protein CCAX7_56360 [Capsulimonas corticalis]|uniref:Uncharacterized protein n=1 Tax=Capsulimonas corticalis TaxID=2219043 RepID=A0A402D0J6_9BACT|nr:Ig-like domain-containing protein [Capsulimonas corticalis]BDI33585.1 hypothetical protein CCAX7_56360 [Capsulimonas corticalis]
MATNETFSPPRTALVRRTLTIVASFALVSASVAATSAATLTVSLTPTGGQYGTIQAAINAASDGDTISVTDGLYSANGDHNLTLTGKHLTIQSLNGPAVTILDNSGGSLSTPRNAVLFSGPTNNNSVLKGFTIKNSISNNGGAVAIVDCAATVAQCIFINNLAGAEGGAIDVVTNNIDGGATISQCSFLGNTAGDLTTNSGFGGAIGCTVNTGTGHQQNVSITNCVFDGNLATYDGGAIDVEGYTSTSPKVSVVNCSFAHNNADGYVSQASNFLPSPSPGSQPGVVDIFGGIATLTNCILYGDTAPTEVSTLSPGFTATYSDIHQSGVSGTGDTNQDPIYSDASHTDPTLDNLHLAINSPEINTGLAGNQTNALGGIVPTIDRDGRVRDASTDLGAYEFLAPVANAQAVTVIENTPTAITLTGSDPNTPVRPLTYSIVTGPTQGVLSGTAPNLTYTPSANYSGSDSFTFTTNNGRYTSPAAMVSINVTHVNQQPTINAILDQTVNENVGPQNVALSGITQGAGDTGQAIIIAASSNNPALIPTPTITYTSANSTGTLTYTPAANAFGTATIAVKVTDNGGVANGGVDTKTITFNIAVNPVVLTPTANNQSVTTNENTAVGVTLTGSDPNAPPKPLTYAVTTNPAHGTLSGTAPNLTYTPNTGYFGSDSFQFTVNNGTQTSGAATVSIAVNRVNNIPTIGAVSDQNVSENSGAHTVSLSAISAGTGDSDQTVIIAATSNNPSLIPDPTVTYTNPNTTGSLTYTPAANAFGTATIAVKVTDNGGVANGGVNTKTITFQIHVSQVILAPTANNQSVTTAQDTAVGITLSGSDPNTPPQPLTYTVTTNPTHGTLSGTAPNLTYTPSAGYFGSDSFTFTTSNGAQTSNTATVSINITQGSATNVTGQITVTRGGYVYNRTTGHYRQSVTLTNTGGAVAGPISLVLDGLTGAALTNATGTTVQTAPAGSPYVNTSGLSAGASTSVVLEFNHQPSGYTPRILAGGGAR